jgi:hypothetical protein
VQHIHRIWRPVIITAIVVGIVFGFISFCVYAGTHWRDAKNAVRTEVLAELNKDNVGIPVERVFEREGFQKIIIPMRISGNDKPITIWLKQ